MSLIIFILILAVLVLIHEFGHFIAAKKNGVKVEEFGFGFPPRVWGIKKGETLYSINALPLGGFVKVYGEEYHETEGKEVNNNLKSRAFVYKKPWQKTVIIVAGVVMNLLLGAAIYYYLLGTNNFQSEPLVKFNDYEFAFGEQSSQVIAGSTTENSPADKAGINTGDIITKVNREGEWVTISSPDSLVNAINKEPDQPIQLELINIKNDARNQVTVVPEFNEELDRHIIGVNLVESVTLSYNSPIEKVFSGFLHSYNLLAYNLSIFKTLIGAAIETGSFAPVSQTVSGPVGIYNVVDDVAQSSGTKVFTNFLNLIALLSLSLALINIMPFPALDGGRLVFVFYEWITGKRPNEKIERYVNVAGIIFLLSLTVLITIQDVGRLINPQP